MKVNQCGAWTIAYHQGKRWPFCFMNYFQSLFFKHIWNFLKIKKKVLFELGN